MADAITSERLHGETLKQEYSADVEKVTSEQRGEIRGGTKRGLKSRHVQLLALGGSIGTGLFIGSGRVLALAGPAGALLSYSIISLVVFAVIQCMGEMTTWLPIPGSVPTYTRRYVDPSLAFASNWNFFYSFSMLVCAEISAACLLIRYWIDLNDGIWIAVLLVVIVLLNTQAVQFFGESEFIFASLKIILIVILLITSFVIGLGGGPDGDRLGFRYWKDPGAFNEYIGTGDWGNFLAFFASLVNAGFSFVFCDALLAISAGECEAPRRNMPKATRRFFWRLIVFYISSILAIGCIVKSTDPRLLSGTGNAASSPFVIGIQNAGIRGMPSFVNALILTSAWSAGNAFAYASSRTLHTMACEGSAPKFLTKCTKNGVPIYCVAVVAAIGLLTFMNVSQGGAKVFSYFVNLSTIGGFVAWIILFITYLRFRAARHAQGIADLGLPYRSPFQPYLAWFGLITISVITLLNGFANFTTGNFTISGFLTAYFGIPFVLVLYIGHKIWNHYKGLPTRFYIPAAEVDLHTGKAAIDYDEQNEEIRLPRNTLERVWFWIA